MDKTQTRNALRIAIRVTMFALLLGGSVQASTLVVCPGGCTYSSIQAAINAATPGDTINVNSGTYNENVDVNKQLILKGVNNGRGMPVLRGIIDADFIVKLNARASIFEGFSVKIHNCTICGGYYGIRVFSNDNIIRNNNISNNFIGVELRSSNNTLNGNIASDNSVGIILAGSSNNNTLSDNNILNNEYGIFLSSEGYVGDIIRVSSPKDNFIHNNHFNNTNNFGSNSGNFGQILLSNFWNTTRTESTNIIKGPYIGGNFWEKPNGTGFSQTCADGDSDGICDSPYYLVKNNIDYLPLANKLITPDTTPPVINNVTLNTTTPNTSQTILVTVNTTDNVAVTSVEANGISLNIQGGNTYTWSGAIAATEGTHSVNVSAIDDANNVAWNNSTCYTAATPIVHRSSISGYKINDTNGNGRWNVGEKGIPGWTIKLIGKDDSNIKEETVTDENGFYEFNDLPKGKFRIQEVMETGWKPTSSDIRNIKLKNRQKSRNNNFTNKLRKLTGMGIISGYKINNSYMQKIQPEQFT